MTGVRGAILGMMPALTLIACAGNPFEVVTGVRSMCDVPFEEGEIVKVSGEFRGDRYHYSFFIDPACPGKVWQADYERPFDRKYEDILNLRGALFGAMDHPVDYRIEVEGRLYIDYEGKPGIEFLKLGKAEPIVDVK